MHFPWQVNASLEAGSRRPKNSDYVMSTEEEAAFAEARSMWEGKRKMREQWEVDGHRLNSGSSFDGLCCINPV